MIARLALAITVVSAPLAAQQPSRATLTARLDSAMRQHRDGGAQASIAVAVFRGHDTLLLRAYGLANRESRRAATPHTVYGIASLTKQITAAAIMRLVEQGRVDLDADISRYVEFPLRGKHVTVRQLLNHTSGIHNYTNDQEWKQHWKEVMTPAAVVGLVARDTLDFPPGTKNAYSNTGYSLLGMIIERASGRPYAQFIEQEFFTPLGLRDTHYCASHPTDTLVAKGYTTHNRQPAAAEFLDMSIPFAAGAVCSSVADYMEWERAFHSGRVLKPSSYTRMMTPDTLLNGARLNYGFGLGVGTMNGHPAVTHGGEINGFTSAQLYLPRDSVGVIVFTNDDSATPQIITFDLARLVLGIPPTGRGALDRPH